ncbi:ATP-binding cassette sub-family G member 5-like [Sycon ciliatum]|uniref:ATP-binding cassette sub-family G member 5-like n=1 Tax=Sycon ciliatum TaxID=27933 RepID=UPI0031F6DC50
MESPKFDVEAQIQSSSSGSSCENREALADYTAGPGASLHVSSLNYFVKRHKTSKSGCLGCCSSTKKNGYSLVEGIDDADKPILRNVSLHLQPGGMLAILGNSGSGKTSLLDCIAQRTVWGSRQTGTIYVDHRPLTTALFRARGAYVMQDDTLLPFLTVRETLSYVLRLRLACSEQDHEAKIDQVIQDLGLRAVQSSVVGGTDVRGISGGERRRVSIAVQLLVEPGLLLLDEPTSGLDSHTAHHLVVMLSQLAASKRHTVVLTIHQPRSDMFHVFDQIMILSRGDTTYCGPANQLVDYFTALGYPCPAYTNPLDEYVDVCSIDTRRTGTMQTSMATVQELAQAFKQSDLAQRITNALPEPDSLSTGSVEVVRDRSPTWISKVFTMASRMNMNLLRARTGMQMRAFQMLLFGVLLFIFILRLKNDQRSIQDRSGVFYQVISAPLFIGMLTAVALFPTLRSSMSREVRDGLYYTPVFMLGYLVHILPFTLFSSVLLSSAFYWATGFANSAMAFVGFSLVVIATQFVGEAIALIMLALFHDANMANSVSALVFSFTALLCSGFLRNIDSMPKVLQDFTYMGVQKYASEILVAHEYPGLTFTCDDVNSTSPVPCRYLSGDAYLAANFPNAVNDLQRNYYCLVGYCVGLYAIAMILFSLRSYVKRR